MSGAPIRILHVCGNVGPTSGGLGAIAYGASDAQRALGHQPAIWTLDGFAGHPEGGGTVADTFPVAGPPGLGYSPAMERAAVSAPGAAFDVVHQHSIWMALSRATRRWAAAHRGPTIIAPQGTLETYTMQVSRWKKRLAWHAWEHANLRRASCLQATSEDEVVSLRRLGFRNPVAVIPNGVPASLLDLPGDGLGFRAKHGIAADVPLMVFLSRVNPKKGLPLLFRAMAGGDEALAGWRLAVCGFEDPPGYRAELERLAAELGITGRIVWAGPVYGGERQDAYAAGDLFVLPTHSDNFAIVVPEALAARTPALTTHGAPWRDLQTHGCGWWVEVGEEPIRAGLLAAARTSREERAAMGERGRDLVAAKYTWPTVAGQMIDVYEWLLGRREMPGFVVLD